MYCKQKAHLDKSPVTSGYDVICPSTARFDDKFTFLEAEPAEGSNDADVNIIKQTKSDDNISQVSVILSTIRKKYIFISQNFIKHNSYWL